MKGLHLWSIKLSNTDQTLNILTKVNSMGLAIAKAGKVIQTEVEFRGNAIVGAKYHGTIDA